MSTEVLENNIDSVERLQTLNKFRYLQNLFEDKFHKGQKDEGRIIDIPQLHKFQKSTSLIPPSILLYPNVPFVKLDNDFHKLDACVKDMKDVSVDTNSEYYVYLHDKSLGQTQILNKVNNEFSPTYIIHVYGKDCEFVTIIYGQIYQRFQYLVEKVTQEAFRKIDQNSLFYTLVENFPNVQQNDSVEDIVQRAVNLIKKHIDIYLVIV